MQRLEGRRGTAQNHSCPLEPRALERHGPSVVARRCALLVARLVLFVHHDRPEPLNGSEHRGAGPHGHAPLAAPQCAPGVGALAVRQSRMQHGDLIAEHAPHPGDGLGRERDLGNQQNGTVTRCDDATKYVEIDQRLSGARHALDQRGRLGWRGQNSGDDVTLVGREVGGRWRRQPGERIAGARHVGVAGQALGHQSVQGSGRQPELRDKMPDRRRAADRLQRLVRHAPLGRALERPLALEQRRQRRGQREHTLHLLGGPRRPLHTPQRPGEERPQRQPERRAVVAIDPDAQREQRRRDRRLRVRSREDRLHRYGGRRGSRIYLRHHPHHPAPQYRHDHARARHDAGGELGWDQIRIGARNRYREDYFGIARLKPRLGAYG